MPAQSHPWEQLPDESNAAFEAFKVYRDYGPRRSLLSAYCKHTGRERVPGMQTPGIWKKYSRDHGWPARVAEFDRYGERLANDAREVAITAVASYNGVEEANDKWVKRREEIRERNYTLAQDLYEKGKEMLAVAIVKRKIVAADPERGRPETHIFEPARWTFKTLTEMFRTAAELERLAAEMPNRVVEEAADTPGGDNQSLFAETPGQLEAVIPDGLVPAMPIDPNTAPNMRIDRDNGMVGAVTPQRLRPGA
jgi:hypothetical protein